MYRLIRILRKALAMALIGFGFRNANGNFAACNCLVVHRRRFSNTCWDFMAKQWLNSVPT
jgi:hypothetical protein